MSDFRPSEIESKNGLDLTITMRPLKFIVKIFLPLFSRRYKPAFRLKNDLSRADFSLNKNKLKRGYSIRVRGLNRVCYLCAGIMVESYRRLKVFG